MRYIKDILLILLCFVTMFLSGCQTSASSTGATDANRSLAPQRVDIRGYIFASRYSDGQVVLEVEGVAPSIYSRYDRAYVLVLPTAQIIGPEGRSLSLSELRQGQNVAILLRGGGRGNRIGIGTVRKMWVESNN